MTDDVHLQPTIIFWTLGVTMSLRELARLGQWPGPKAWQSSKK